MAHRKQPGIPADEAVVPVVEETAVVHKERVATETVHLRKRVREEVAVERDAAPRDADRDPNP